MIHTAAASWLLAVASSLAYLTSPTSLVILAVDSCIDGLILDTHDELFGGFLRHCSSHGFHPGLGLDDWTVNVDERIMGELRRQMVSLVYICHGVGGVAAIERDRQGLFASAAFLPPQRFLCFRSPARCLYRNICCCARTNMNMRHLSNVKSFKLFVIIHENDNTVPIKYSIHLC